MIGATAKPRVALRSTEETTPFELYHACDEILATPDQLSPAATVVV